MNLRRLWPLIRRVYTGEVLDLATASFFVKTLRVPLFGYAERRIDEDFNELTFPDQAPGHAALRTKWRDKRREHDEARIEHKLGNLTCTPDVLDAVGFGEPKVFVESVADVVTVKNVGVISHGVKLLFHEI